MEGLYLERTGKLLILQSVPMEAYADTHVLENERVFALLELNLRRSQYADSNIHIGCKGTIKNRHTQICMPIYDKYAI